LLAHWAVHRSFAVWHWYPVTPEKFAPPGIEHGLGEGEQ
jgi:hypothetical protein